jgi:hypothetical protein
MHGQVNMKTHLSFSARGIFTFLLVLTVAASAAPVHKTFDAFAVWESRAQLVPISAATAVVAGTAGGPLFIEGDYGPEESGNVACPMTIEINLQTGHQVGQGYCTFTAGNGDKAFGSWRCGGSVAEGYQRQTGPHGCTSRYEARAFGGFLRLLAAAHQGSVTQRLYLRVVAIVENFALRCVPMAVSAVMITTAINAQSNHIQ